MQRHTIYVAFSYLKWGIYTQITHLDSNKTDSLYEMTTN